MKRSMNNWLVFILVLLAASVVIYILGGVGSARSITTKGVRIGFSQSWQVLRYPGAGHLITVAQPV